MEQAQQAPAGASLGRTSSVMALVANINRSKKTRAYKPADFNPYATPQAPGLLHLSNRIPEDMARQSLWCTAGPQCRWL